MNLNNNVSARRVWIDAVRALCVIAIVLLHFQIWVFGPTQVAYPGEMVGWAEVTNFLVAFRMPALFAVSGLLVSNRVRRGWSDRRNALRTVSSLYLYLVWLIIYALFTALLYMSTQPFLDLATYLFAPHPTLWFILFLAVNVALLTTLHRLHPAVVLGALAALSVLMLSFSAESPWEFLERGAYYMLFFAIGVFFKPGLTRFASEGLWWKFPAATVLLWVTIEGLSSAPFRSTAWFGLFLARDLSAVLAAVAISAALTTISPIARILSYLGRRTLSVYVLHVPLIWATVNIRNHLVGETFDFGLAWIAGPAVGVIGIIVACLIIGKLLRKVRVGRMLFELPPVIGAYILDSSRSTVPGAPTNPGGEK